ncbi:rCG62453 [Rattus norvegicus]|uniref:RCG62453 n=1 Tax=Rattus norvegicus TaxID=10116 RepID=A6J5U6_RAT|nr:rCG62453 [Rattus norvegicus]
MEAAEGDPPSVCILLGTSEAMLQTTQDLEHEGRINLLEKRLDLFSENLVKNLPWDWKDGSAVKRTDCSSRGCEFNPSNHMTFTTVCDSRPKGYYAFVMYQAFTWYINMHE